MAYLGQRLMYTIKEEKKPYHAGFKNKMTLGF